MGKTTFILKRKTFATTVIGGASVAKLAQQNTAAIAKSGGRMAGKTTTQVVKNGGSLNAGGQVLEGSKARRDYTNFWETADLGKTNTTTTNTVLGTAKNNETGAVRNITTGTNSSRLDKYKVGERPKPQTPQTPQAPTTPPSSTPTTPPTATDTAGKGMSKGTKWALGIGGLGLAGTVYGAKKIDDAASGLSG